MKIVTSKICICNTKNLGKKQKYQVKLLSEKV